jgi:hypothetical protein
MNIPQSKRRQVNESISAFSVETLSHGTLRIPDQRLHTHLQFRRFAGCPVCNLHLKQFARGKARLDAAGIRSIAFFHSTAEQMRPYQGDLPLAAIADPERTWYRRFGVERSAFAVVHPRVMMSALVGLVGAPSNPLVGGGDQTGLPADFLIAPDGKLVALHYGAHADDQWSLDELLAHLIDVS